MIGSICFYCGEIIEDKYKLVPLDGINFTNLFFHNTTEHPCYTTASANIAEYLKENIDRIRLYNFGIPTKDQIKMNKKSQLKENEDDVQEKRFGWSANTSNESDASSDDGDATSE